MPIWNFLSGTAWATGTTTVTPATPSGGHAPALGERLFVAVVYKRTATPPDTPADWTVAAGPVVVGTGADGAGTGQLGIIVFTRIHDGAALPAIVRTGTGSVMAAKCFIPRADPGESITWVSSSGSDVTADTSWSATGGSLAVAAGDYLVGITGITSATPTYTSPALGGSGATWTGTATIGTAQTSTTSGDDLRAASYYTIADTSTGAATPAATGTLSTGTGATGGTLFLRLRGEVVSSGVTGAGALTIGPLTVAGAGTVTSPPVTGAGAATLAAPAVAGAGTVRILGAGAATLGAPVVAGSGTLRLTGAGALQLSPLTVSGAGTVADAPVTGSGAAVLGPLDISGDGTMRLAGAGALVLGAPVVAGTGTLRILGAGQLDLAPLTVAGDGLAYDPASFRNISVVVGRPLRAGLTVGAPARGRLTVGAAARRDLTIGSRS